MDLSPRQHQALQQLRDLTNGADDDVAAGVLRSVDWDVQRAAELIFGSGAPPPPPTPPAQRPPAFEPLEMDDTQQGQGQGAAPRRPAPTTTALLTLARPLLALLSLPLHLLAALARLVLTALRLPVPSFPFPALRFAGLSFYRAARWGAGSNVGAGGRGGRGGGGGGKGAAERWVRALEEETGAVARGVPAAGASTSLAAGASGVGLVSRGSASASAGAGGSGTGESGDGARRLPAFALCTYEEFLRSLARDARIGCAVLVSAEHDADAAFKRATLTDPEFIRLLDTHGILVWGGDVREPDAWSAAEKLQATTFPFLAFLALQPTRAPTSPSSSSRSPSSTPTLTVLSRHSGPAQTAPHALTAHLEAQLLPRVAPFLARLAALQRERTRDRELRAAQDAAFASAAARDKARIDAALAAERAAKEAARAKEEAARRAEREAEREREAAARKAGERVAWRRWTRRAIVDKLPAVGGGGGGGGGLRVALRLPSGARVVHAFDGSATLTTLYAVVDAALLPSDLPPAEDPLEPPTAPPKLPQQAQHLSGGGQSELSTPSALRTLEAHVASTGGAGGGAYWGFRVASAYPRAELRWAPSARLAGVAALRGGGQVVVELLDAGHGRGRRAGAKASSGAGAGEGSREGEAGGEGEADGDDEDDGYDTEESE
ncbi:hypothetical protein HYPSUDRAFT_41573 [Hypholoma sublateritium FD-334 SS-4]|uniref:UBX domain-containing protein n=1 Tax=Hypholoma sublateritium (strain FD-334 SS-4) TaxID=945553 RepID=A0A0D2NSD0_HYPSF|nr:hypothetical protein HYPSUDRAFT_41573 [Hypholoma sublateritium FD-334 SS-4]